VPRRLNVRRSAVSLVRWRASAARDSRLPYLQSVTKTAGREPTLGAPRLAAPRTVYVPTARNTYTHTEEMTRTVCVLRRASIRVRPYLRIRGVYGRRQRGTLE